MAELRHRDTFLDDRGRRAIGGHAVYTTRHAASGPNTPELRRLAPIDRHGIAEVWLPPGVYLVITRLQSSDGRWLDQSRYLTLEAQ